MTKKSKYIIGIIAVAASILIVVWIRSGMQAYYPVDIQKDNEAIERKHKECIGLPKETCEPMQSKSK